MLTSSLGYYTIRNMKTFLPAIILGLFTLLSQAFAAPSHSLHTGSCVIYTKGSDNQIKVIDSKAGSVSGKTTTETQNNCAIAVREELGLSGDAAENVVPATDVNPKMDEYDLHDMIVKEGKIITLVIGEPVKKN